MGLLGCLVYFSHMPKYSELSRRRRPAKGDYSLIGRTAPHGMIEPKGKEFISKTEHVSSLGLICIFRHKELDVNAS